MIAKSKNRLFLSKKKVYIIAEAGVNHNGNLTKAYKLIDVAAKANADAVKFQIFDPDNLCVPGTTQADYQKKNFKSKDQNSMLKKLILKKENYFSLKKYAIKKGLDFIVTPFDKENLVFLVKELKLRLIKISSGDLNNFEILNELKKLKISVILSTGASTFREVKRSINFIEQDKFYKKKNNLAILHCTSDYPAKNDQLNLCSIKSLQKLNYPIGYSDHSEDVFTPSLAVSLGARIIEKHFTLNKRMIGPDHKASLNPSELIKMVKLIRSTEKKLGTEKKIITKSEIRNKKIIRRSIVAKINIKKNQKFSFENLTCKRPAMGIDASKYLNFIGKKSNRNYKKDEFIIYRKI